DAPGNRENLAVPPERPHHVLRLVPGGWQRHREGSGFSSRLHREMGALPPVELRRLAEAVLTDGYVHHLLGVHVEVAERHTERPGRILVPSLVQRGDGKALRRGWAEGSLR